MTSAKTLLAAWDLKAKKELGQNFLADPSTAARIVRRAGIGAQDAVVEIGAGLGALTVPAGRAAGRLIAIEKDRRMIDLLQTELLAAGLDRVEIVHEDILKTDFSALAARVAGRPLVVMGNLPYNISSQVLVRLVENRHLVQRAVLMFQKELAQRLTATPGTKAYGRITVMLDYCSDVETIAEVPAAHFFPRPKIDSEVVGIRFRPPTPPAAADEAFLFRVVKAGFGQRRKILRNALRGGSLGLAPQAIDAAMDEAGIDPTCRGETLTATAFSSLANALYQHCSPA